MSECEAGCGPTLTMLELMETPSVTLSGGVFGATETEGTVDRPSFSLCQRGDQVDDSDSGEDTNGSSNTTNDNSSEGDNSTSNETGGGGNGTSAASGMCVSLLTISLCLVFGW